MYFLIKLSSKFVNLIVKKSLDCFNQLNENIPGSNHPYAPFYFVNEL